MNPSDELVKYFLSRPEIKTGGRITTQIIEKHRAATAEAMQKVMGVTISQSISEAASPAISEPIYSNSVIDLIKQISPEIECKEEQHDGVTVVYLIKNGVTFGRIRYSVKRNSTRYDYTESVSGKLTFIHEIEEYKKLIPQIT